VAHAVRLASAGGSRRGIGEEILFASLRATLRRSTTVYPLKKKRERRLKGRQKKVRLLKSDKKSETLSTINIEIMNITPNFRL
jgi:hypothetical protein